MPVVTWDGSSSTAYSTAANWDTGSVPADGDDVVIPDTSSINACNVDSNDSCNSLTVLSNGEIGSNNGSKLVILGEADGTGATTNGFAVNIDGVITDNGGTSLDLDIRTPTTTSIDMTASSGKVRNIVLNHASCTVNAETTVDISGNLTINAGTYNANGNLLTVAGDVDVTGTLTGSSGAMSFGSLTINSGGTYSATSGTTTITSETSGGFAMVDQGTFTHNNGTVQIGDGSTAVGSGTHTKVDTFYNLTVNMSASSVDAILRPNSGSTVTVANDLTVTQGEVYRNNVSDTLTVTGDVDIAANGTLGRTNDTGASNFGSLRIVSGGTYIATSGTTTLTKESDTGGTDFMFHNDGTFTHNNGKFLFDDAGLSSNSNVRCSSSFYDVELTMGSFFLISHHNMNVANDFTVTTGTYSDGSNGFTITGDVSVASTATLLLSNSSTQTKTLGSISVASGGTFRACRGTTTISKANGGTDGRAFFIHGSATFNHNNGLVKFTASSPQVAPTSTGQTSTSHPFYDLEQTTGTMQWKAEHHKVLNNCTMQGSAFNGSTGNVHVLGICRLTGETFNSGDTATNDNNFFQTLVIESGATVDVSAIDITVGSLRNLGGTIQ